MADPEKFFGQQGTFDDSSDYNARDFHIRQKIGEVRTLVPVKVIAVHGGGVGPAPTIDVQPLINQIDGQGNQTPHGIIYGIPVSRSQGGGNTIINDPKAGDLGHMSVADRDMSALKANKGQTSNPGSYRMHDLADGVYHGNLFNQAAPDQYIHFRDDGITLADRNGNIIETKPGSIAMTGNLTVTGEVTAGFGGGDAVTLQGHTHPTTPPGPEAPPNPGT
ncbi:Gp138 family membrane-puncturing spike protein [Rhizobium rhizogenes]|uniref:Gp138 family membrane-puncturing spike protein n=1 Tax=Rhizobium rhizogenes TaxID=359 RepID=UPI0022720D83|nr:Gp138 family membrane-puncturing spike protein [Rhizobium rhizogenes]